MHVPINIHRLAAQPQTEANECLPSDFVSQRLGWDDGGLLANAFVCMEIHSQTSVVFLDDDLSGLLDSLRAYATLELDGKANRYSLECSY